MVAALDYCLHGRGGAAPSIDTAMHGLVDAPHVDHLHPDNGIAFATAADGERPTRDCFGDRVAWVAWRRPGFQLGLDIAEIRRANPRRSGRSSAVTGSPPGASPPTRAKPTRSNHQHCRAYIAANGRPARSGRTSQTTRRFPRRSAWRGRPTSSRSSVAWPPPIARRSGTSATAKSCSTSSLARRIRGWRRSGPRAGTTSCGRRFGPCSSTCPVGAARGHDRSAAELHAAYRDEDRAYYKRHAEPDPPRCAARTRRSSSSLGWDAQLRGDEADRTGRGEFYVNAINVMRGAEALSIYAPIPKSEKFRIEYWALEEAKLRGCRSPDRSRRGSRS